MPLSNPLHYYQDELEAELRAVLSGVSSPLYDMMCYHLGWVDEKGRSQHGSGKLSRPTLCLIACEAVGGNWRSALPAAAAIELIHNFSLIHDDIQDGSQERRNRPTVWKLWGEAQGINAGDAMYAAAQLAVLQLSGKGIPPEKVILLSQELNSASIHLCEGQYLDIEYEERLDIVADRYLDMIGKKTACLFETSLLLGALLGTDNQAQVSALGLFGRNIGMAFQMQNDLQGIWGEAEDGKKAPYTDITNKKKTLPIIYALEKAEGEERDRLVHIYGKARIASKADIVQVLRALDKTGARGYTEHMRDQYHLKGLEALAMAGIPQSFEGELQEITASLLGG